MASLAYWALSVPTSARIVGMEKLGSAAAIQFLMNVIPPIFAAPIGARVSRIELRYKAPILIMSPSRSSRVRRVAWACRRTAGRRTSTLSSSVRSPQSWRPLSSSPYGCTSARSSLRRCKGFMPRRIWGGLEWVVWGCIPHDAQPDDCAVARPRTYLGDISAPCSGLLHVSLHSHFSHTYLEHHDFACTARTIVSHTY